MGEVVQQVVEGAPESPVALAAQRYAEKCGWHLLPMCEVEEHGLGAASATSDVETLREWFRARPSANLAWVPSRSGMVVVSIDSTNEGQKTFAQLASGPLPDTIRWIEPPGRVHLAFAFDDPSAFGGAPRSLGPGVQLVVGDGIVAVPPSTGPAGRHRWVRSPLVHEVARMPDWLEENILAAIGAGEATGGNRPSESTLPVDERLKRARAYLQAVLQRSSCLGAEGVLMDVVAGVVRGFHLPEADALALFAREFNERCRDGHTGDPLPWDHDALSTAIQNAVQQGQVGWGSMLDRSLS